MDSLTIGLEGERRVKRILAALFLASFAAGLLAQSAPQGNPPAKVHLFPARGAAHLSTRAGLGNLRYHSGGPVIPSAKVVNIFWGPSFSDLTSPDSTYAQTLILFRNQFGTTPDYNTITQYSQVLSG